MNTLYYKPSHLLAYLTPSSEVVLNDSIMNNAITNELIIKTILRVILFWFT